MSFTRIVPLLFAGLGLLAPAPARAGEAWPSFRGPAASGVASAEARPPRTWDAASGANVRWSTPIPGLAHSSPVLWGDRVYLTTAVGPGEAELKVGLYGSIDSVEDEGEHAFKVMCLDAADGAVVWERTAHTGTPAVKRHPKGTHANSTPATDGTYVVAFFGSEGLYCYRTSGELAWTKSLGVLNGGMPGLPAYEWGFSSSPVIHDGRVILQCDVQDDSFVTALDLATGNEIWRTKRDENPTWSTPAVIEHGGRTQVVCNGYLHIGGYDLATGSELWRLRGGGDIPVPTPILAHGLIFITNAHGRQAPIYAIKAGVTGTLSADPVDGHMAWSTERSGNYMQTPLVYGDELYCCRDNGVLACYDARTGTKHYRERLGSGTTGFTASGVAGGGAVYFSSETGDIHVVKAGPEFELLAVNAMGENCMATPAIVGDTIYVRTRGHVVALADETPPTP